ncbi:MAG: hypothetical protein K0S16_2239 [Moraxellaceae bacterium]|jgi:hypothetical protein|nr:hypothetical protein [Moraxellaceae bacterium]
MTIATLNQDCHCTTLDAAALQQAWHDGVGLGSDAASFFAPYGVYLDTAQVQALQQAVTVLHRVLQRPAVIDAVAAEQGRGLPRFGTQGVCMGYDFHFDGSTPRLIEINTNAGGMLLNALLLAHQQVCCDFMQGFSADAFGASAPGTRLLQMFREEWAAAGRSGEPRRIAIVDERPAQQFLYPEFLLFRKLFESAGWQAVICDPQELVREGGRLLVQGEPVDMVYNRLTDFALLEPAQARLREAWLAGEAVVTPDPWHHALQADKRNLVHFADTEWLAAHGASAEERALLAQVVPPTRRVAAQNADELWAQRKQLFFKPLRGFGSRAAYRGDKLTKSVWADIVASHDYVAQAYAPPGTRRVRVDGELRDMKFDIRCYAYRGEILLLAARVYQGQTTNMRTQGGGFAPVFAPALPALQGAA